MGLLDEFPVLYWSEMEPNPPRSGSKPWTDLSSRVPQWRRGERFVTTLSTRWTDVAIDGTRLCRQFMNQTGSRSEISHVQGDNAQHTRGWNTVRVCNDNVERV